MDELLSTGAFETCELHFKRRVGLYRAMPDYAERLAQHIVFQFVSSVEADYTGSPLVLGVKSNK